MVECAAIRCFDSNLWNYGHLCELLCLDAGFSLEETIPSVCIVSLLDCSTSSRLVFQDCFLFWSTHPRAYLSGSICACTKRSECTYPGEFSVSTDVFWGEIKTETEVFWKAPDCCASERVIFSSSPILLKMCEWELYQHLQHTRKSEEKVKMFHK